MRLDKIMNYFALRKLPLRQRPLHCSLVWRDTFLVIAILLALAPTGYAQMSAKKYQVRHSDSWLLAITGKTGVFSFAAHKHAVLASRWSADVSADRNDPQKSKATIKIPVSSLVIDSQEARQKAGLGAGPGAKDVHTIQERMLSPEVLDARRYPEIQFTTTSVEKTNDGQLRITGRFQMHGHSKTLSIPVQYEQNESGSARVHGEFTIKQTDFGLTPQSVAGGTVKVTDEVTIRFQVSIVPAS
jgi:polyisoprenoid-binding protein YceI